MCSSSRKILEASQALASDCDQAATYTVLGATVVNTAATTALTANAVTTVSTAATLAGCATTTAHIMPGAGIVIGVSKIWLGITEIINYWMPAESSSSIEDSYTRDFALIIGSGLPDEESIETQVPMLTEKQPQLSNGIWTTLSGVPVLLGSVAAVMQAGFLPVAFTGAAVTAFMDLLAQQKELAQLRRDPNILSKDTDKQLKQIRKKEISMALKSIEILGWILLATGHPVGGLLVVASLLYKVSVEGTLTKDLFNHGAALAKSIKNGLCFFCCPSSNSQTEKHSPTTLPFHFSPLQ